MIFAETRLKDAFVVNAEVKRDERGPFSRMWCEHEFEKYKAQHETRAVQRRNKRKGTLLGAAVPPQLVDADLCD